MTSLPQPTLAPASALPELQGSTLEPSPTAVEEAALDTPAVVQTASKLPDVPLEPSPTAVEDTALESPPLATTSPSPPSLVGKTSPQPAAAADADTATSKSDAKLETPKKHKKLHSFFKPRTPTGKSKASVLSPTGVAALKSVVQKPDELPIDIQERIARNRAAARAKLLARAAAASSSPASDLAVGLEPSWKSALTGSLKLDYASTLAKFVASERQKATIYPAPGEVFSAFNHSSFHRTKVVIIGQDPYHGPNQAHGMSFSVKPGVPFPPSLRNIFKELTSDIVGFKTPKDGCLEKWANQGVLLLNSVLTVRKHQAHAHAGRGWEKFTDAVVKCINERASSKNPVVFMLWGGSAKRKGACINKKRHCILTAAHPSPLSAHRGWFGSGHFSKANEFLIASGQTPVDWTL